MLPTQYPAELQYQIEKDIAVEKLTAGNVSTFEEFKNLYSARSDDLNLVLKSIHRKGLICFEEENRIRILGFPESGITSVFQYAEKSQLNPSTVVRRVDVIQADSLIADKLAIEIGSPIFVQVRTRMIKNEILANQYNFIPYFICPGLELLDLSHSSFQVALEREFHTIITKIDEQYKMALPSRDDTEILGINDTDHVLVVQRISYCRSNLPVVFADIHVNPQLFHYVEDLWPEAVELVQNFLDGKEHLSK